MICTAHQILFGCSNRKQMGWAGTVARMVDRRIAYRVLVRKPHVKEPLGRPRRSWKDNIKMKSSVSGMSNMDWIGLAQDRDRWRGGL